MLTVFWKEWIKTETRHLQIDQKQGRVGELKDLFSVFSFSKEHVRIKRIQSTAFTWTERGVIGMFCSLTSQ